MVARAKMDKATALRLAALARERTPAATEAQLRKLGRDSRGARSSFKGSRGAHAPCSAVNKAAVSDAREPGNN
jgi:hypothetical protein